MSTHGNASLCRQYTISVPAQEFIFGTSATVLGNCLGVIPGNPQGRVVATVGSDNIQGSFTETDPAGDTATFIINAPLTTATTLSGTYGPSGTLPPNCSDIGNYVATKTTSLSGSYSGQLTYPDGSHETVSVTMTQDAAYNVTVSGTATGGMQDGPINLTGTVTGNLAVLNGTTKSGQPLNVLPGTSKPRRCNLRMSRDKNSATRPLDARPATSASVSTHIPWILTSFGFAQATSRSRERFQTNLTRRSRNGCL